MIKKDIEAILKNKIFYVCLIIISGYYLVQTSFAWGFNDAAGFLFSAIYSNISILPLIIGLPSSFLIFNHVENEVFMEIAYSLFWFTIAFIMLMIGLNKKRNTGIWKN